MVHDIYYEAPNSQDDEVLRNADFEATIGEEENLITLKRSNSEPILNGGFLYAETSENGGIIDAMEEVSGDDGKVTYSGRSYTGIINSHVIRPSIGSLSGDANEVISKVIDHLDLSDVFEASGDKSRITISYEVDDYLPGYEGLIEILKSSNAKLKIRHADRKVELSAQSISSSGEVESSEKKYQLTIKKVYRSTNHLLCLGPSEEMDLYLDNDGNVVKNQHYFGVDQITEIYDQREASAGDLEEKGTEHLLSLVESDSCEIDLLNDDGSLDVGDLVSGTDDALDIEVTAVIKQKSFSLSGGEQHFGYEAGNLSMTQSGGGFSSGSELSGGSGSQLGFKVGNTLILLDGVLDAKVTPSQIEDLNSLVSLAREESSNAESAANSALSEVAGKAEFEHYHDASDIQTGELSIENGGTGSSTAKEAQFNLLNDMNEAQSDMADDFYFVNACSQTDASAINGAIQKRKASFVWNWVYKKIKSLVSADDISAADKAHSHEVKEISDFPSAMPASDVSEWAKQSSKPPYSAQEVGAAAEDHTHQYAGSDSVGGAASSAVKLQTERTIRFQGAANGFFSFDGTKDVVVNLEGDSAAASFLAAHPVGSIFFTVITGDPSDTYGGSWRRLPSSGGFMWVRES